MVKQKIHNLLAYLLIFSIPFEYWDAIGLIGTITIPRIIGIVYFLYSVFLIPKFLFMNFRARIDFYLLLFLFLYLGIVTSLNSYFGYYNSLFNFTFFQNILLFGLLSYHVSQSRNLVYKLLITFCISVCLMAILFSLGIGSTNLGLRYTFFGENANNISSYMVFTISLIGYFVFFNPIKLSVYRYFALLAIPFLGNVLLLTASRGASITLIIVIFLFILLRRYHSFFAIFSTIGLLIVFYLLFLNFMASDSYLAVRLSTLIDSKDIGEREIIWNTVYQMGLDNPIFGIGEAGYDRNILIWFSTEKAAHNAFLYLFAISGIIGLFSFVLFCLILFKRSMYLFRVFRDPIGIILFIITLLFILRSGSFFGFKTIWFFYAMISGMASSIDCFNFIKLKNE